MPSIHQFYGNRWMWDPNQYPGQKVVWDGEAKIIYVNEGVTEINVSVDLYSAWKEWILNAQDETDPAAWEKAFTAVGGDPITDTQDLGVTYFLENGWRIQPFASGKSYTLTVSGNLYTREPGETPFLFAEGVSTSLVRSNIVDLITIEAAGVAISNTDIAAIAANTASDVWNSLLSSYTTDGTTGKKLGKIATKVQDIALR